MDYEVEIEIPSGRPYFTNQISLRWHGEKAVRTNKNDAVNHSKWKKLIKYFE